MGLNSLAGMRSARIRNGITAATHGRSLFTVPLTDLSQKFRLASVAGMPDFNDLLSISQTARRICRVVADGNQTARLQKQDELGEKLLADSTLASVVGPIAEGIARFVRMQGKHIPQENR